MNKHQRDIFIRGSSKDKNPLSFQQHAKHPLKGISLVSTKQNQRQSNMSTRMESQMQETEAYGSIRSSFSIENVVERLGRQSFNLSEKQRSTYESDLATGYRSSNIQQDQQEFNLFIKEEDPQITEYREILDLSRLQARNFDTVKESFHEKANEPCQREYQFLSLTHKKKQAIKKRRIALNKAYFHLCNEIFNVSYSQEEIMIIDSIFEGELKAVEIAIKFRPNLLKFRMKNTNYNLFYIAAMSGHVEMVEFFIKKGYCLDFKTGRSLPINVAAWCGHYLVVKLLIDYQVPYKAKNQCFQKTAIDQTENTEVIQLLNDINEYMLKRILAQKLKQEERKLIQSIVEGQFHKMKDMISNNKQLLNFRSSYNHYSLLSIAIMSQNIEAIRFILKTGCYLDMSTSYTSLMHIAVQSGNIKIVELLLQYGLPHKMPDRYGYLPIELAESGEMKSMLQKADHDKVNRLAAQLIEKGLLIGVINIFDQKNNFFGRKLILKNYLKDFANYKNAFHGTEFENLLSIAQYNLLKAGTQIGPKKIQICKGHIQQNQNFNNKKNWGHAIYTTPSIYYAGHYYSVPTSSQDVVAKDILMLSPVVQVKVKNGTFDQYEETTGGMYKARKDEPKNLEFRTEVIKGQEDSIVVVAIIFSTQDQYGKMVFSFEKITELALNGKDEQVLQMYREVQKTRTLF